jgi:UDP-N-acetylglucosamine 2-epimerase (non-hydrolysing)
MSVSICFVVGARPNFMKVAPVLRALRQLEPDAEVILVHTGQHYDSAMSDVFLDELGMRAPDVHLGVGSVTHGEQTARALVGIETVLAERRPSLVVVPGDVNSTLAGALAAAKLQIPVAHLEAGLRSFDPAMPEEHNRKLTDHLSDVLLTHSAGAGANLAREGIDAARVHLVGNTMIDSLLAHVDAARDRRPWETWRLPRRGYGLVTLHRPALVDDPALLSATVEHLVELARSFPLVFPVHPRTLARLTALSLDRLLDESDVVTVAPVGYSSFLGLEAEALCVITDSGGVQEETSALGVPCFTLRDSTERPITLELGTNVLLGADPSRIGDIPDLLERPLPSEPIPYWDGNAGERAAAVVMQFLVSRDAARFAA